MNVKELKALLEKYPDDMEVLYCLHSDYERLEADDICTRGAVDQNGYFMRSNHRMSLDNKAREKTYLIFPGN